MNLPQHASSGGAWVGISTLTKGFLQVIQLIILARILTPIELGIVAVINLVIGFAQIFGDGGLSNALIYHKELNKNQKNQLFVVNLLFGVLLSLIVALLSTPIAAFFAMPELASLLLLLSPIFFIRSLGQQIQALLQQTMAFKTLAKIEIAAQVVGFTVLSTLLNLNYKAEAVVFAQLTTALCLVFCFYTLKDLRPALARVNFSEIKQPIRYGLYQSGESLVNYTSAQLDQILVGKLLGAETLGIYAYIKDLVFKPALQLINPVVNKVAFPLMVNFSDSENRAKIYLSMLTLLCFINAPLYLFASANSEWLLSLTYGTEWGIHAELFTWMAYYMLLISIVNPVGVLLRSTGNVKRAFWWNILVTAIRPAAVVVAISGSVLLLAQTLTVLQLVFIGLHVVLLLKPIANIGVYSLAKVVLPPICMCVVLTTLSQWLIQPTTLAAVIISVALCIAIYLLAMFPFLKQLKSELRSF